MKYKIEHTEEGWVVFTSLPDGVGGSLDARIVHPQLRHLPHNLLLLIKLRRTYRGLMKAGLTAFQAVGVITNSIAKTSSRKAYDPSQDELLPDVEA